MRDTSDIKQIIQAAVSAAYDAGMQGVDEKIQAAVNLGVAVGTEIGVRIGAQFGAAEGAEAAVKAVDRERKRIRRQAYDSRLYNTKLLLRHYRALNEHYRNAIFDVQTAEASDEDFADIMQAMNSTITDEELYIESIKQSCIRTKVIMAHVNKMLDIYKVMCERSHRADDERHWRVLEAMYIADTGTTTGAIAEREHINKRTVYKDIDCCVADLTALLFGIDGVSRE